MNCQEVEKKLMELPVERFSELQPHLAGCASCRRKAEAIRATEEEHRRILEEDARRPQLDGAEDGEHLQGLAGFTHAGLSSTTKGAFWKPASIALVITAGLFVIFGPRIMQQSSVTDAAPKPDAQQIFSVLGGKPEDIAAPTAPARISIVPIIIQEGHKVRAPLSLPPRTTVWFALYSTQHANIDLCMSWPGSTQAIWSGYVNTGRTEVPEKGHLMDVTGQYTFSMSRAGDGSCRDPEATITLEVQP